MRSSSAGPLPGRVWRSNAREEIKVLFKLQLRQTTGMVASLLKLADLDWAVPDYTTMRHRQKTLAAQFPYRRADGPLNLPLDSTGIKFLGDGALSLYAGNPLPGNKWQARKHGIQGRRQSLPGNGLLASRERGGKVHPAMDSATSDNRAVDFSSSSDGDSSVLPDLLDQIPEGAQIGTVTAPSRQFALQSPVGQWTVPRNPSLPRRHHRLADHPDHPDLQERPVVESRLPGSDCLPRFGILAGRDHGMGTAFGPSRGLQANHCRATDGSGC